MQHLQSIAIERTGRFGDDPNGPACAGFASAVGGYWVATRESTPRKPRVSRPAE